MAKKTCDTCGNEANFEKSPEGQLCGVCSRWICNDCQDCKAGLGNEPYPKEDVVCKRCSGFFSQSRIKITD